MPMIQHRPLAQCSATIIGALWQTKKRLHYDIKPPYEETWLSNVAMIKICHNFHWLLRMLRSWVKQMTGAGAARPGLGSTRQHRRSRDWRNEISLELGHNWDLRDSHEYIQKQVWGERSFTRQSRKESDNQADRKFEHCLLWFRSAHIFWNNLCTHESLSYLSCDGD